MDEIGERRDANVFCPLCGPLYATVIVGDNYDAFIEVRRNACRIEVEVDGFRAEVHRCGPGIPTDEEEAYSRARDHTVSLGDVRETMIDGEQPSERSEHERYEDLVINDRVDELLQDVTEEQVAEAWARYENRYVGTTETPDDDPDWWAVDLWMSEEWFADERRVREGILRLVDLAARDEVLEFIGVSIMEGDFFTAVGSRLDWVEERAAISPRFRKVLANLYVWDQVPDAVAARIERAAGVRLPGSRT